MFKQEDVKIDTDGGPIEVDVDCGFTQHLDFDCRLFDGQGNNPQKIHEGSNLQTDPPPFAINVVPPQLLGRLMLITATVQRLAGPDFSVDATLMQDGQQIGKISVEGTFEDHKTVSLVARFV